MLHSSFFSRIAATWFGEIVGKTSSSEQVPSHSAVGRHRLFDWLALIDNTYCGFILRVSTGTISQTVGRAGSIGFLAVICAFGLTLSQSYAQIYDSHDLGLPRHPPDVTGIDMGSSFFAAQVSGTGEFQYVNSGAWTVLRGVSSAGNTVYCAFESGLMVIDVSDPGAPHIHTRTLLPKGAPEDIQVSLGHAYIAKGDAGVFILDVSDSDTAKLVARILVPGWTYAVTVAPLDPLVWLGGSDGVLRSYDITDPGHPVLISSYSLPDWIRDITVVDSLVYVACDDSGLYIIDAGSAPSPVLISRYLSAGRLYNVAVSGGLAALGQSSGRVTILDVSDPITPIARDSLSGLSAVSGVSIRSPMIYVATGGGLRVIDASNPADAVLIATYDVGTSVTGVTLADSLAFVAVFNYSFDVVSILDPASPTTVSRLKLLDLVGAVTLADSILYVTASTDGVLAMDLTTKPDFTILSQWKTTGRIYTVSIHDTLAYACGNDSLYVLSCARPDSLYRVASNSGIAISAIVVDTLVYVCSYDDGLRILNVSNPSSPILVGTYQTIGPAMAVTVQSGIAYIADREYGLEIVRVADPTNLTYLGRYPTRGMALAVMIVRDTLLFVADDDFGLLVLNVTDPTAPILVSGLDLYQGLGGFVQVGSRLFATGGVSPGKVYAIDVSEPSNPRLEAEYSTSGVPHAIDARGDTAYVGDAFALLVLHFVPATAITDEPVTLPKELTLLTNYPNPFNPATTICYWVAKPSHVTLSIHNVLGQQVVTLVDALLSPGWKEVRWDSHDADGHVMPSGVYFALLRAGPLQDQRKLLLLR